MPVGGLLFVSLMALLEPRSIARHESLLLELSAIPLVSIDKSPDELASDAFEGLAGEIGQSATPPTFVIVVEMSQMLSGTTRALRVESLEYRDRTSCHSVEPGRFEPVNPNLFEGRKRGVEIPEPCDELDELGMLPSPLWATGGRLDYVARSAIVSMPLHPTVDPAERHPVRLEGDESHVLFTNQSSGHTSLKCVKFAGSPRRARQHHEPSVLDSLQERIDRALVIRQRDGMGIDSLNDRLSMGHVSLQGDTA